MSLFKAFVPAILLFAAPFASAKDLSGRMGVGFNNQFSNSTSSRSLPALSVKYGMTKGLHVQGLLGFNTATPTGFTLGGKVYRNIFYETNLNFYGALGLAYLKSGTAGMEIMGLLGCEFFIPGVDSLGFLFEAGVSGTNMGESGTNNFHLKTVGFTFLHAGMHFYF